MRSKILPAGVLLLLLASFSPAQVNVFLDGPAEAPLCDTVTMTARVVNAGETLAGLIVTQRLPNADYVYVPSQSVVRLPGGIVLTNGAAEPTARNATNLVWDFSSFVSTANVGRILITEVMYDPTNAVEDAYEWFELYNPTLGPIGMTNWTIVDVNPGQSDILPTLTINPGEYVIFAANTNNFLAQYPTYTGRVFAIADGKIGSGLNNFSDGLFLKNGSGVNQDAMSYGVSTAAFSPPIPLVSVQGRSLIRNPANEDSNSAADWDEGVPNPGTGTTVTGLRNGEQISVAFRVEITCNAFGAEFRTDARYQQPPGSAPASAWDALFLTINQGNLTIRKTPILQASGYNDVFTWSVIVRNEGFGDARNVEITDTAGSGIQLLGFSVNPTNIPPYSNAVTWTSASFPALTNLAVGQQVSIVVTARAVECENLYNDADARWGCRGFVAATNSTCENTALIDETARATIDFQNRPPLLSGKITPAAPIAVSYCGGASVTITITNPSSAGPARNLELIPTSLSGFGLSGAAVGTNGHIVVGSVDPGVSTSIVVTLSATNCPVPQGQQFLVLLSQYEDLCGNPFSALGLFTTFEATQPPGATVLKQMQDELSGGATAPVTVLVYYSNMLSTALSIRDTYPRDPSNLLSVANISAPGVNDGTNITWNVSLTGSGVYTARFSIVASGASQCGTPDFFLQNVITVPNYIDCVGCVRPVVGSGQSYPLSFYPSCPGGGTGGCAVASSKTVSTPLAEVCTPVVITQRFVFTGALPSNNWQGVVFQSDLAGGTVDSNAVRVLVDGTNGVSSNVTSWTTFSNTIPNLVLSFNRLTNTPFYAPSTVSTMTFVWAVTSTSTGQSADGSYLTLGRCGSRSIRAYWAQGESLLGITLWPITNSDACGIAYMRIDVTNLPSPGVQGQPAAAFPSYDARVVLNLDADGDALFSYDYVTNSTRFTNMLNTGGSPIASAEPTVAGSLLTWDIGDLASNGAGTITFRLRASCAAFTAEKMASYVQYNNRCNDGGVPRTLRADSYTNVCPPLFAADLLEEIQPQYSFLTSSQFVTRIEMMNVGAGGAYEVETEMLLPSNIVFGAASIAPVFVSSTNVRWEFHTTPTGDLQDLDGDGSQDDLAPNGRFAVWVTNYVIACGLSYVDVRSSCGCKGSRCDITPTARAQFETAQGSLVTRVVFPAERYLCVTNQAEYAVRNAGLVDLYNIKAKLELPAGITYLPGSGKYVFQGVTNATIGDPAGTGGPGDPLIWSKTQIPELATLQPTQTVTILFSFPTACDAVSGGGQFIAIGEFTDICGTTNTTSQGLALADVRAPVLSVLKEGSYDGGANFTPGRVVLDVGDVVVYRVTIDHAVTSQTGINSLQLIDTLPTNVAFVGASPAPDSQTGVTGAVLRWSTTNLLASLGGPPYEIADPAIVVYVTGTVVTCLQDVDNSAVVDYGCSESDMCITASDTQTLRTRPVVSVLGSAVALTLNTCGGTKTVTVTNDGSTAGGIRVRETAPAGYIFASASATGEFNSASLTLALSGSPVGSVADINFTTTNASGAVDVDDDAGNGAALMDLGFGNSFKVTFQLVSAGNNLDCSANPRDVDYADPEPGPPALVSGISTVSFASVCGVTGAVTASSSLYPDLPDPDIDLQPNSYIATNNETVNFTVTVVNGAEKGNAESLHVRVRFGKGWTNLTLVSSNIVQTGAGTMQVEQQGDTNVLIELPGVILDPLDDFVQLVFSVKAVENAGDKNILAEVAGDCDDPSVVPSCVFTNTLGQPPLVDTMSGALIGPVNGQYYGFDEDQTYVAGYALSKTVRLAGEAPAAATTSRTARVGEDLVYRITATYSGNVYSNVTVEESLPTNLVFGTPYNYAFSGSITNATWSPATGVFTLQPSVLASNPSTFTVDIPVIVSNMLANQNGVVVTNTGDSHFTVEGVTNTPVPSATIIRILEPDLILTKAVNSNLVQSGDIVIFTNRLTHTGLSATSAYDVVFSDTLPYGLTFSGLSLTSDGIDNDGDGATDEADEATLVSGNTFTVTTNQNAFLYELAVSNAVLFRFPALVTNQIIGASMVNTSRVTWTSLTGVGTNGNERDGSGGVNDYTNSATVSLSSKSIGAITKTFVSSSQTNTVDAGTNVFTIGERMVYAIRVDIPQGISGQLSITDAVPPGMDWVGGNTNAGLTFPGYGYSFYQPANVYFPTSTAQGLVIVDADPTPNTSTNNDGSGSNVVFRFGAITNTPDGEFTNDYFVLSMEFTILNHATNDGVLPGIYSNNNRAAVSDPYTTRSTNGPRYSIAEHNILLTKSMNPTAVDASNLVTVTMVVSNDQQALANAYDIWVTDILSNSVFDVSTLSVTVVPDGWSWSTSGLANGVVYNLFTTNTTALPRGTAVTNQFTIRVSQGVRPNQTYPNRANVTNSDTIYGDPPGGIPQRNDTTNSTANLTVTNLAIVKSFFGSSETNIPPDSTTTNAQIGERITYRIDITLPEATVTNLQITDFFASNGLAYIRNSARTVTTNFGGALGTLSENPTGTGLLATNGQVINFVFTNATVVTGDNDPNNNSFALLVDALVLDTNQNSGLPGAQTVHTNWARVSFAGSTAGAVTSGVVQTRVIEPRLRIFKNIVQTNADAGDTVDIQLTVTNDGLATAYDVVIDDPLNPLYFIPASAVAVTVPTGFVFSVAGNSVFFSSDTNAPTGTNTIEVGESLLFSFQVNMAGTLPPNAVVTNRAIVTGDSLASTNIFAVQRFTSSTNTDTITADNFGLVKTLWGTSETRPSDSTNDLVQIGEVVTYQLETVLPEGTISNLTVNDYLPNGLAYVVGSAVFDTSGLNGTLAPITNITPNTPPLGTNGEDVLVRLLGNTVVASDNDPNNNTLRLRFSAIVLDTNSNAGVSPQTVLTNVATITYDANPRGPATSGVVTVTVIEPVVTIAKSIDIPSGDAGDRAVVTLVLTNSGTATAYDLAITDTVYGAFFDVTSLTNLSMPAGFTYAVATNGADGVVRYAADTASGPPTNTLEAGESLAFQFSVNLAQAVQPGQVLTNVAVVSLGDTIYGTNVYAVSRDKSGSKSNDTVVVSNMTIGKVLAGTSENGPADTVGARVAIGERALYVLYVTLPEATITNLVVNDLLPAGMACVTSSVSVDVTGFGGSLPAAPSISSNATFLFSGLTVVSNNNDGLDNTFQIVFEAVTLDVSSNDGLPASVDGDGVTTLSNVATVAYNGYPPASTSEIRRVDVQEPSLLIQKTMSGPSNGLVDIVFVVTNRGLATAYDVILRDTFPSNWWITGLIAGTMPTGFVYSVTNAPGDGYLTILSDTNTLQPTNTIEVGESLLFHFTAQVQPTARGVITNTVWVNQYTTVDGTNVDERFEPQTNSVALLPLPGYGLSKTLVSPSGRAAAVGETVTFNLVVTNNGGVTLNPVRLDDTFNGTHLSFASAVPSVSGSGAGTVWWTNVGPLAIGGTTTLVVNFTAAASTQPGDTTNRVVGTVYTTNGLPLPPLTSSVPVEITTVGYTLSKTWTSPTNRAAQVGEAVQFSVTIVNTGEETLVTAPVADTYETNYLTYVGSAPPTVDNVNDGAINWTDVGPIPVGSSTTLWLNFTARISSQSLPRTNTVSTSPTTPGGAPTVPPSTNRAPYEISSLGYTLTKTRTSPVGRAAQVGEAVIFNITITNTGEVQLVTVPVTDSFENGYLSFVSSLPAPSLQFPGALLWANIGPLPAGASTSIVATFTAVASTLSVDHTNAVSTTPTTPTNEPPVLPQTNRAPYDVSLAGYRIDKVLMSPIHRPAIIGEPVRFEVRLFNTGDVALVTVPVTDRYETVYLTYIDSIPPTADNVNDGEIVWPDVGPLAVGASTTLVVNFTAAGSTLGVSRTNDVSAAPTTPTNEPPVPVRDSNAVYRVDASASLGDFVWNDLNANGVQDGGETGVANVVVTLYDTNSAVVGVTTTSVSGAYAFTNLIPGTYFVGVTVPGGYTVSPQNQGGDDALDSDIDIFSGQTGIYTLNAGETNLTIDAGLYQVTALGDYMWEDVNGNGVQDLGEPSVTNVTVRLYDALTNVLATTATDAAGFYQFANLTPGDYFVEFVAPAGYRFTRQDVGADTGDSDANPVTGRTVPTTLTSGEYDPTWDAGLYRPASLGDFVWLDVNGNGIQDGGSETGLPGVVVTLYDAATNAMGVTTTAVNGAYAFTNLMPATYFVGFAPPAGYQITIRDNGADTVDSDADPATGYTAPTTLISGENDPTWDAGLYQPASLGDFVWLDRDGDGVQGGAGEMGLIGTVVTLYDAASNVMGVTTSGVLGAYAFTNLMPATYFVGFAPPAGYQITIRDNGADTVDSDADPATGYTAPTTLISGENDPTWDAGLYQPASLGDFIWHDLNANGIQDGGETGIASVVVRLYNTNSVVVGVVTTDVNGLYLFTNLPPAGYYVEVDVPAGWSISPQDQGADEAIDSDINGAGTTSTRILISNQFEPRVDGGLYLPASLGDFVWEDMDRNGVQDGGEPAVTNVTVRLYDAQTNLLGTTATDASGFYTFTNLVPGTYFVEFVPALGYELTLADQGSDATDSDANAATGRTIPTILGSGENDPTWDAGLYRVAALGDYVWEDLNADGVQNIGEPGISNVTVRLYDADTNLLGTTTTDASGLYSFTNLLPWTYLVQFDLPAGYNFSPADQGGDTTDSDAGAGGFAPAVTLISGEVNPTIDAGLYRLAELGDRVWVDTNGNGIQDAGEFGIAGVTVTLYNASSGVISTQLTGAFGTYLFTNLVPATYYINVSLPADFHFTLQDQGADDTLDSDVNTGTGDSGNYTLSSGQTNLTVDAGVYQWASIGDRVWEDMNYNAIQDTNELTSSFVTGLVVRLYTSNNILYATTTTDTNGYYLFGQLPPGGYFVEFVCPTTHVFVLSSQGTNTTLDSDADRTTGRTPVTFLESGEADLTWDAGIIGFGEIGDHVWVDLNNDGIHNEDLSMWGMNGVRVYLYRVSGGVTTYVASAVTATDTNGARGYYVFPGLPFGNYRVVVEKADIPPKLTIDTTVLAYNVQLRPDYLYLDADFGFNGPPTPVELKSFTATRIDNGVWVRWETAVEMENLGFNIYRSLSFDGTRTRINGDLISGLGSSAGQSYELVDNSADPALKLYYWLEDVSWGFERKVHGPAVVNGNETASAEGTLLGTFSVGGAKTLHRISYETLAAAGIPVQSADPASLQLLVDGRQVAAFVNAANQVMKPGDFILFYARVSTNEAACEIRMGKPEESLRMEEVYTAPVDGTGSVWYGVANADGWLSFSTAPLYVRYLLLGFADEDVYAMDVTDPSRPKLLFGFSWLTAGQETGLYMSYFPENPAECLAVSRSKVHEVERVSKP